MKKNKILRNLILLLSLIVAGLLVNEITQRSYEYFIGKNELRMQRENIRSFLSCKAMGNLDKVKLEILNMLVFGDADKQKEPVLIQELLPELKQTLVLLEKGGKMKLLETPEIATQAMFSQDTYFYEAFPEDQVIFEKLQADIFNLELKVNQYFSKQKQSNFSSSENRKMALLFFLLLDSIKKSVKRIWEDSNQHKLVLQEKIVSENDHYLVSKTMTKILSIAVILGVGIILAKKLIKNQAKMELANSNTEKIIDSMPVGVLIIAEDFSIQGVNKEAMKIMGAESEEEILGIPSEEIFGKDKKLEDTRELHEYAGVGHPAKIQTLKKETIKVLKSYIPINLDGRDVVLLTVADVSELEKSGKSSF